MRKANNGEDSYELALLLENIGNIFKLKGDFTKARAFQEEALAIILISVGEKSVEAVRLFNNLGNLYSSIGLFKKADKRLKKALKIVDNLYVSTEEQQQLRALCLCSIGELHRLKGNLGNNKAGLICSDIAHMLRPGRERTGVLVRGIGDPRRGVWLGSH